MEFERFSLKGFLKLIQVGNLGIVGFTQYMGAIFLGNKDHPWLETVADPKMALLVFSTLCITAAGYIINDYYDIKIDYINKPWAEDEVQMRVEWALNGKPDESATG